MLRSTKIMGAALLAASVQATDQEFSYVDGGDNWYSEHGYSTCANGMEQSPIDLSTSQWDLSANGNMQVLGFNYENFSNYEAEISWESSYIGASFKSKAEYLVVYPDASADIFEPVSLKFHAPSEHTVEGKSYDAEMQILHVYKGTDGLQGTMIGVFFDQEDGGIQDNAFLDQLWEEGENLSLATLI